jgi:hypothetical protein
MMEAFRREYERAQAELIRIREANPVKDADPAKAAKLAQDAELAEDAQKKAAATLEDVHRKAALQTKLAKNLYLPLCNLSTWPVDRDRPARRLLRQRL